MKLFEALFQWQRIFAKLPLYQFHSGVFIILSWLLLFRFTLIPIQELLDSVFGRQITNVWWPSSLTKEIVINVMIVPLFETFIFLKVFFSAAQRLRFLLYHPRFMITASAVIFGFQHFYSVEYILYATVLGYVFGSAYYFGGRTHRTFWMIVTAHSIFNGICLAISLAEAPSTV